MIIKTNNKDNNFYNYLGRFFGSRIVELTTQDRIYDDNNKEWYLYIFKNAVTSFASVANNKIKNIYSTNDEHLEELLNYIKKDTVITPSIVTNIYTDMYQKCGFKLSAEGYKNFVKIWSNENE